jgi:4-diphosphocytidyl-2-C-methyl-D-erythritol kinase
VAAQIGADVPYFLMGGTALGLARGDDLYPLPDLPPYHVVLGLPAFGVSTADTYRWFDQDAAGSGRARMADVAGIPAWPGRALVVVNDLQAPVVARHPQIGTLCDTLVRAGARAAAMTGSGSAVFGLFDRGLPARRAARTLAGLGVMALVTTTVGRQTCLRGLRRVAG